MILVLLLQETSAFNATFSLARHLLAVGERVAFVVDAHYRDYVASQGFEALEFEPATTPMTPGRPSAAADAAELASLKALAEAQPIEMVLLDQIIWYKAVPFLERGLPVLGLNTTFAGHWQTRTPPVFSRSQSLNPLRNALDWLDLMVRPRQHTNNKPLPKLLRREGGRRLWLERRRAVVAAGGRITWGEYGWRLRVPELVLGPRCLDWPWAGERAYAGLSVDGQRKPSKSMPLPAFSEKQQLVYASFGTFGRFNPDRLRFFQELAEAAAQRPHQHLIIQLDDGPEALPDVAGNVTVCAWVPQLEVLAKAALFFTHGGFSSVREAIHFGVPMIALPLINDQFGNGARLVYHGLGLSADPHKENRHSLGLLMDQVLATTSFKQRVAIMQAQAMAEGEQGHGLVLEHLERARQRNTQ